MKIIGLNSNKAIKFGNAIKPFAISAKIQTISNFIIAPVNIAIITIKINKKKAALSNLRLFCSENFLKFPLTKIPTNVGRAIKRNILTENFNKFKSNSTSLKNDE